MGSVAHRTGYFREINKIQGVFLLDRKGRKEGSAFIRAENFALKPLCSCMAYKPVVTVNTQTKQYRFEYMSHGNLRSDVQHKT
jgi:hypothetical protein